MKKTLLIIATLTLLVGAPTLVHAADTNAPGGSTNATVKPYPLDYCLVSGDKIGGDMGKPIVTVYHGQEIKFCCSDCPADFKKNPEKYMKKLAEAEKKQGVTDKK
ncbi:MAG TPA: hypothetical protein VHG89_11370 [Verrucomicrobiae bacterium]|nr:hypothetical protein [Verrucomicrobiae bacterium]